ncbi:Potential queD like 2 [Pseudoalteromonas luteoviolacea B = ATCC 29581]|nr:Potential queD like 2 [Pseudoalteromonas luteoviolacea B = ATCC 29581]
MQIERILLGEAQLNTQLNQSVQQGRRGDFAMMLSMLSQDALDFSQFHLPQSTTEEKDKSEQALKRLLQIGPQKPLAPETFDLLLAEEDAFIVQSFGMTAMRLKECLMPEPFAVRNDKKHIPFEVKDNCELAVRRKIQQQTAKVNKVQMNAAAFYDDLASKAHESILSSVA